MQKVTDALAKLGCRASYADPVEVDGSTIISVAASGFLYDSGGSADVRQSGEGGDAKRLAGVSLPLGAYISRDGFTRYEPNMIALLIAAVPFVCVAGRVLVRLVKVLSR